MPFRIVCERIEAIIGAGVSGKSESANSETSPTLSHKVNMSITWFFFSFLNAT